MSKYTVVGGPSESRLTRFFKWLFRIKDEPLTSTQSRLPGHRWTCKCTGCNPLRCLEQDHDWLYSDQSNVRVCKRCNLVSLIAKPVLRLILVQYSIDIDDVPHNYITVITEAESKEVAIADAERKLRNGELLGLRPNVGEVYPRPGVYVRYVCDWGPVPKQDSPLLNESNKSQIAGLEAIKRQIEEAKRLGLGSSKNPKLP